MTPSLKFSVDNGIAVVELNRPEQLNSLDVDMIQGLEDAFARIHQDDSIRVAILTGAGKAFCAGLDLKSLSQGGEVVNGHNKGQETVFIRAITDCSKPVIGAINGACIAGGLEIAMCCDFLYASEYAKFADTHAFVGILPGWGLSQKLPRIVGIQRAKELSLSGRFFSATEAKNWGLINEVYTPSELMPNTQKMAMKIAEAESDVLHQLKDMMDTGWQMPLKEALVYETNISVPYSQSLDLSVMEERLKLLRERK